MDHLPLEIGQLHHISIHDSNTTNPCRGQIQQQGGSQPTAANTKHRSRLQPELTGSTNLGKDQMAGVAPPLISTQHRVVMHGFECPRAESGFHPHCGPHAATRPAGQARQRGSTSDSPFVPSADPGARERAQTPDGNGPPQDNVDGDPAPIAGLPTAPSDPPETCCDGRGQAADRMPPAPRHCNRARSWSALNILNSSVVPAARRSLLRGGAPTKSGPDPCGIGDQSAARMA